MRGGVEASRCVHGLPGVPGRACGRFRRDDAEVRLHNREGSRGSAEQQRSDHHSGTDPAPLGSGKGKFTTKGKYASATVRGTNWLVADYADHTQITVKKGLVAVKNFATGKIVLVPGGHTVVVNAKKPKTHH